MIILIHSLLIQVEVHHEDLSILVFRRMLANNPKLLAEFVSEGLTEGHVKLIENMIDPPPIEERDKRLFLYEVKKMHVWTLNIINLILS